MTKLLLITVLLYGFIPIQAAYIAVNNIMIILVDRIGNSHIDINTTSTLQNQATFYYGGIQVKEVNRNNNKHSMASCSNQFRSTQELNRIYDHISTP